MAGCHAEGAEGVAVQGSTQPQQLSPRAAASTLYRMDAHAVVDALMTQPPQTTLAGRILTSRYRGVCWNKKNRRWQAAINNGGKYIYLGSYDNEELAARAFDQAALRIRGFDRARLNFSISNYLDAEGNLLYNKDIDAQLRHHGVGGYGRSQMELDMCELDVPMSPATLGEPALHDSLQSSGLPLQLAAALPSALGPQQLVRPASTGTTSLGLGSVGTHQQRRATRHYSINGSAMAGPPSGLDSVSNMMAAHSIMPDLAAQIKANLAMQQQQQQQPLPDLTGVMQDLLERVCPQMPPFTVVESFVLPVGATLMSGCTVQGRVGVLFSCTPGLELSQCSHLPLEQHLLLSSLLRGEGGGAVGAGLWSSGAASGAEQSGLDVLGVFANKDTARQVCIGVLHLLEDNLLLQQPHHSSQQQQQHSPHNGSAMVEDSPSGMQGVVSTGCGGPPSNQGQEQQLTRSDDRKRERSQEPAPRSVQQLLQEGRVSKDPLLALAVVAEAKEASEAGTREGVVSEPWLRGPWSGGASAAAGPQLGPPVAPLSATQQQQQQQQVRLAQGLPSGLDQAVCAGGAGGAADAPGSSGSLGIVVQQPQHPQQQVLQSMYVDLQTGQLMLMDSSGNGSANSQKHAAAGGGAVASLPPASAAVAAKLELLGQQIHQHQQRQQQQQVLLPNVFLSTQPSQQQHQPLQQHQHHQHPNHGQQQEQQQPQQHFSQQALQQLLLLPPAEHLMPLGPNALLDLCKAEAVQQRPAAPASQAGGLGIMGIVSNPLLQYQLLQHVNQQR